MTEMYAKYAGKCKKCGMQIRVGDRINWTKENGASHVACPEQAEAKPAKVDPDAVYFVPDGLKNEVVKLYWRDGEYYSGHSPSCSKEAKEALEKLGLCHYLSGWGTAMNDGDKIVKALGEEFTLAQAEGFARPKLEAIAKAKSDRENARNEKDRAAFEEAKRTGNPVAIRQWSEECDGSTDECDIDNITIYAMPDGTTKKTRSHSW